VTPLANHVSAFLHERLPRERAASHNTCESYATALQLLFEFAASRLNKLPCQLYLEELEAPLILDFLQHLESERANSPSTRNIRLSAIKSFMRFVQYRVPSAMEQILQILAIPKKRTETRLVKHLSVNETQAILDAPDPVTRHGIRDRAMLHVAYAAGLRVSELVGLRVDDLSLGSVVSIRIRGKGRKERRLPLWQETASALRAWLVVRGDAKAPELFLNSKDEAMTRWGFDYVLKKHVRTAAQRHPSLLQKTVSPHVLRHTCAIVILQATHDLRKVALWLGHASVQTTEMYTRVDPKTKLEALDAVTPPNLRRGRFRPPDKLIAMLRAPTLCGVRDQEKGVKMRLTTRGST
jgi:site-specific recombinase XerD